jgi:L-fuconolactonase
MTNRNVLFDGHTADRQASEGQSRRDCLRGLAAGTIAATAGSWAVPGFGPLTGQQAWAAPAPATVAPWRIDTHTHFYDPRRPQGVPWPSPDDRLLYRPVLPDDYRELATPLGIRGTVVVEASPWLADNQWLLDLAADAPMLLAIVGNVDPLSDTFTQDVRRLAKSAKFRGIRINQEPLQQVLADPELRSRLGVLGELGLSLDINGGPELLQLVPTLSREFPQLTVVINHLANPLIDQLPTPAWKRDLQLASEGSHVMLKVSALAEGARRAFTTIPRELDHYVPWLDHAYQAFGAERLVFGSNWPVSDIAAPLTFVVQLADEYFLRHGEAVHRKVFAENAARIYRWPEPAGL